MNFFGLEFKLLWRSRLTWIVGIVALLLSVLYAFAIVKYSSTIHMDQNGKMVTLTGLDAIHENQKHYKPFEGKITDQVLRNDLKAYQTISKKYNGAIPDDIYVKDLIPRISRLDELAALYTGNSSDLSVLSGLSPEQVTDFYGKRTEYLKKALAENYPNSPSARQEALSLNFKIKTPFNFGQKEIILIVAGFITLMAVACFTMLLSSVCPTPISSLIMGIGFCVLPSIIWSIAQGDAGNPAALICNFFPAGGVGFGNALSYQLDKIMFLTIGPVSI